MMLNPWLWLGFLMMLIGAGFTGYRQGVKVTKADYEQAASGAMTKIIERHNELATADIKAVVKAEKRRQAQRMDRLEKQHELELEATRNHKPACDWSDRERGLLNNLVDSANGKEATPGGVSGGLRPPAEADGQSGQRREGVGWAGRLGLR